MILRNVIGRLSSARNTQNKAELYRKLLRHEAKIGGQIFGPVGSNGRREFFCLDERTWIWHEEWIDREGQRRYATTRYDIRPNTVLKSQNGRYQPMSQQEARNLFNAAKLYEQRINEEIYSFVT